ncbi:MAG: hypothetical protein Q9169_006856 [Polycauliona sp. 2 TL-2023]
MQVSSLYPGYEPLQIPISDDITIAGVRSGTGPPLLLLHGFPQTHLIWHKIAPHLTKHFTLIIPDLRGYGSSSKPASTNPDNHSLYSKSAMATDMISLMQKLDFSSKFYVCAHDRGARVAHKLCVDYPDKVEKCILLDICPTKAMFLASRHPFAQLYWHWYFLSQRSPFPEDVIAALPKAFAQKTLADPSLYGETAYAAYAAQFEDRETVHAMCEDYRAAAKEDIEEQITDEEAGRKIQCPLRVLWGKEGVVEKLFDARAEWRKACEKGALDEEGSFAVEGGHFIPEERPEDVVGCVLEFFT